MKTIHVLVFLCLVAQIGCHSATDSGLRAEFAIYRLKDANLTAYQVWSQPLENLVLADTAFIGTKDLRSYRWQTHEFTVTATVDSQLAVLKRSLGPTGGIPFVVVAGTDRIYLGVFWYGYSSLKPQVPFIDAIGNPHRICKCESVLVLEDKRNDARICRALKEAGILIE